MSKGKNQVSIIGILVEKKKAKTLIELTEGAQKENAKIDEPINEKAPNNIKTEDALDVPNKSEEKQKEEINNEVEERKVVNEKKEDDKINKEKDDDKNHDKKEIKEEKKEEKKEKKKKKRKEKNITYKYKKQPLSANSKARLRKVLYTEYNKRIRVLNIGVILVIALYLGWSAWSYYD